jgi:acyl transferase domain-containing protein
MWNILFEGKNVVGEIPPERFDWKEFYGDPAEEPGKINCKWCGCMPGISEFDPLFFEISPKEAELMDPRQRILLQEAWKALEDAGYGSDRINKNCTGMFVGVEDGDYHVFTGDKAAITSNHNAVLSARLSYFLNLSGPTMAINTACSSGLTAVHQACLSLLSGECDMAVAAGVSMILAKETYLSMGQAGMLSKDGICHAFDRSANGMVPGEAVAVVVLKKLSKALKNKDAIYAVIKGSGINYDGKTNGITAPNGVSQAELLKKVYDRHAINPENIEYIVTHGTGTKLGDPVEINALYDTFKDYTNKVGYCALTSNKTNFGHTLAASGIVSLYNLVLAMKHEVIPASLNCRMENNYINWKESPFYVNKANRDWRDGADKVRTGAVSAFGMSGTNVHMVVNSFNEKTNNEKGHAHYYLLAFSAKKEESLKNKLNDMYSYFINTEAEMIDLYNISYTLLKGRHHFNFRCAFVVKDVKEAVDMLERAISGEKLSGRFYGKVSRDFRGQKTVAVHVEELLNRIMSSNVNIIEYGEMLSTLADAYCQGYEIDWNKLYTAFEPRIVHLPTYPFIKGSYWVENTNDKPA